MYTNEQLVEKFLSLIETNADIMAYLGEVKFKDDCGFLIYCKVIRNSAEMVRVHKFMYFLKKMNRCQ